MAQLIPHFALLVLNYLGNKPFVLSVFLIVFLLDRNGAWAPDDVIDESLPFLKLIIEAQEVALGLKRSHSCPTLIVRVLNRAEFKRQLILALVWIDVIGHEGTFPDDLLHVIKLVRVYNL